jgi:hypothetical protein
MPTVVDCPHCCRRLNVPEELLGRKVKCVNCGGTFEAQSPPPPAALESVKPPTELAPPTRPDADDEKIRCPRCGERIYADADRCRYCGENLDDSEEDYRPWEHGRGVRRDCEPHRSSTILVLGIISILCSALVPCCGAIGLVSFIIGLSVGIPGWVMGSRDLAKMRAGEMDPRGERATRNGRTCAIIGVVLNIVGIVLAVMFQVIMWTVVMPSMTPPSPTPPPGGGSAGKISVDPLVLRIHNYLPSRNLAYDNGKLGKRIASRGLGF